MENMTDTASVADPYEGLRDDKGRVHIPHLTDRELMEETVRQLRSVADALADLEQTPMMQAMKTGSNPFMAMFGR